VRNCTEDEGLAPRSRLAGVGFKPPKAALVKSQGSERLGKVTEENFAVTVFSAKACSKALTKHLSRINQPK